MTTLADDLDTILCEYRALGAMAGRDGPEGWLRALAQAAGEPNPETPRGGLCRLLHFASATVAYVTRAPICYRPVGSRFATAAERRRYGCTHVVYMDGGKRA